MAKGNIKEKLKNIFNRERFVRFLDRQGFYVVLFICICVIGITAIITSGGDKGFKNLNKEDIIAKDEAPKSNEDIDIKVKDTIPPPDKTIEDNNALNDESESKQPQNDQKLDNSDKQSADNDKTPENGGKAKDKEEAAGKTELTDKTNNKTSAQTVKSNDKTSAQTVKTNNKTTSSNKALAADNAKPVSAQAKSYKSVLIMPVEGQILKGYASDDLVYSKTLREWRTHSGIDIESALGSEVKAVQTGTVHKIEEDPLMGIIITIDHGNGLMSRYANLSTKDMVKVGQKINQGQTISGIGRTATIEGLDAPHLHFEIIKDGKNADPVKYFK